MKSPWHRWGEDQHAPVEMRFIDMFMTALGSLVFLALLLVFLLPQTTRSEQEKRPEEITKPEPGSVDVVAENKKLRDQLEIQKARQQRLQSEFETQKVLIQQLQRTREVQSPSQAPPTPAQPGRTEDKDIVKRGFGVILMASGCRTGEPELYVRWEGKVIDYESGEPRPDPMEFDASEVWRKTTFVGQRYVDIGVGPEHSDISQAVLRETGFAGLEALSKSGLHTKLFYGVGRAVGSFSVYAGLRDPRAQGRKECVIYPFYLSSLGLIPGEKISLMQQQPYAWLRRFNLNIDGTTTFGTPPRTDEAFKRDLVEFSKKQSGKLCEKKIVCDAMDAHLALLEPQRTQWKRDGDFNVFLNYDIHGGDLRRLQNVEQTACKAACSDDTACKAFSYDRLNKWCFLKSDLKPLMVDPTSVAAIRVALPAPSPSDAKVQLDRRPARKYSGTLHGNTTTMTLDSCESACQNEAKCVAYSFVTKPGTCSLFESLSGTVRDKAVNSGIKMQLAR